MMRLSSSKKDLSHRPLRLAGLTLAVAGLSLASQAAAQAELRVGATGANSGVPVAAAKNLHLCVGDGAPGTTEFRLSGGVPGKMGAIHLGLQPTDIPIFGVRLRVVPLISHYAPIDAQGNMTLTVPGPRPLGFKFYAQGGQFDPQNFGGFVSHTAGLEIEVIPSEGRAFQRARAKMLMRMSDLAYLTKTEIADQLPAGWKLIDVVDRTNNTTWTRQHLPSTFGFVAKGPGCETVVAFRGTRSSPQAFVNDMLTNFQALGQVDGFHKGFYNAFKITQRELLAIASRVANPRAKVMFTGHSLGGALATVGSYYLTPYLQSLGYARDNVLLYTFGAPRSTNRTRAASVGSRVPHSYAVANRDDLVTYVPPVFGGYYAHIPNLRVIYPRLSMLAQNGLTYTRDGAAANVANHKLAVYLHRIDHILPAPKVWLSVNSKGKMRLNWSFPGRAAYGFAQDKIALFAQNPHADPGNWVTLQWVGASSSGYWDTGKAQGTFYCAYVQQERLLGARQILAASPRFVPATKASVWCTYGALRRVVLNWSVSRPGADDYVALFDRHPSTAGPNGYLALTKVGTVGRTSWGSARFGKGFYIGYVKVDGNTGAKRVIASWGPTQ